MTLAEFCHLTVGTPFKPCGREYGALDCWGVVLLAYRDCAGIELPTLGDVDGLELAKLAHTVGAISASEPWSVVTEPQAFDVAVMSGRLRTDGTTRRVAVHVGIMIDARRLLHVERNTHCAIVPLSHPSVKFRLRSLHRHEALAHVAAA